MKRLQELVFFVCLVSLVVSVASLPPGDPLGAQEKAAPELFAEGYALYLKQDFANAAAALLGTLNRESPLEDYSLYYLGEIALALGDPDGARERFTQIAERFPHSTWALPAELGLAKIMLAAEDYAGAAHKLHGVLGRSGKQEISGEAMLLLARVHGTQGRLEDAYSLYQEVRQNFPQSGWAAKAREEVKKIRHERPQQFGVASVEALAEEAALLYRERQLDESGELYRQVLRQVPRGRPRAGYLKRLAQVYLDQRRREEAIPVLNQIASQHGASPEAPEALYQLARIHWNRDENVRALSYFTKLQQRYPRADFNDLAQLAKARIYESRGNPAEARRLYEGFAKKYPHSPLRADAAWELGWLLHRQADYAGAREVFNKLAQTDQGTRHKTGALYWQGRMAERMGLAEEAKQAFSAIANSPEESYYHGLATRRLERMGARPAEPPLRPKEPEPFTSPALNATGSSHLARARELARLALHELAIRELDAMSDVAGPDPEPRLLLVHEYSRNHAFARSLALANQFPDRAEELRRYRYPLAYWEPIQRLSETAGLDPYLVVALIRQESLFDPKAVSPASAYGLMQLLPSTGARVARWLSLDSFSAERLFEPELNLRLGTRYLKELMEQFPHSLPKAIAAYNAGENAVARWEKQIPAEDEEVFIERIPYLETRLYVKLVLRNHRTYTKIYDRQRTASDEEKAPLVETPDRDHPGR